MLDDWKHRHANSNPEREQQAFILAKQQWLKQRAEATKLKKEIPEAPSPFKNQVVMAPARLFNGMIAPLVPYKVRGVLCYQGERNAAGPFTRRFGTQLRTLIDDWRSRWGDDM